MRRLFLSRKIADAFLGPDECGLVVMVVVMVMMVVVMVVIGLRAGSSGNTSHQSEQK
jgi:hypothetical protein